MKLTVGKSMTSTFSTKGWYTFSFLFLYYFSIFIIVNAVSLIYEGTVICDQIDLWKSCDQQVVEILDLIMTH